MSRYHTRSSQFGLADGAAQPTSELVLVAEPSNMFAPEARKGRLYIVAEASQDSARARDACQMVIRTIRKSFYDDSSYSVTSALRRAVSAANRALYQQNFNNQAQKRVMVGVTCAVIKDKDLYLAQVLPAQSYLLNDGKLRATPPVAAWGNGLPTLAPQVPVGALGTSLSTAPEFYRSVLRPGDTLLLCSSGLIRALGREDLLRLLRSTDPAQIAAQVQDLGQRAACPSAHGLVVCASAALGADASASPAHAGVGPGQRLWRGAGNAIERMTGAAMQRLQPGLRERHQKSELRREHARREQSQMLTLPEEPPPIPADIPPLEPLDLGDSLEQRIEQERAERLTRLGAPPPRPPDSGMPPSAFLGEGGYYTPPAPGERRIDLSDTPGMSVLGQGARRPHSQPDLPIEPTLGERLSRPFEQAAGTLTSMGRRRRLRRPPPRAMPQSRRRGLSYRREGPPFPWMLLALLVTLVALLVLYGTNLSQQNAQQHANDLLAEAERQVRQIGQAPSTTAAQQLLLTAGESLDAVRATSVITDSPENRQRFELVQREYNRFVAEIERVSPLTDLELIGTHPQAAASAGFASVVVPPPPSGISNTLSFNAIYLLDSNAGVLYRMPKAGGAPQPFLSPNDVYGAGLPVGKVRAIAWREDNIVAVTQNDGGPYIYYFREGDTWRFSNLGGSEEWGRTANERFQLVTYQGNLYVWGASPGQILKYFSGRPGDLYDPWIKTEGGPNRDDALDIAVDGNIYLLQPDGSVLVYELNGFKREIAAPTLNPPLVSPTGGFLVTGETPESGSIFMVDTVNERIIQIDKQSGALIQQIRAPADGTVRLDQLAAVYVDTSAARPLLYLVNGGSVLRASLPDAPPPFRAGGATPAPQ